MKENHLPAINSFISFFFYLKKNLLFCSTFDLCNHFVTKCNHKNFFCNLLGSSEFQTLIPGAGVTSRQHPGTLQNDSIDLKFSHNFVTIL